MPAAGNPKHTLPLTTSPPKRTSEEDASTEYPQVSRVERCGWRSPRSRSRSRWSATRALAPGTDRRRVPRPRDQARASRHGHRDHRATRRRPVGTRVVLHSKAVPYDHDPPRLVDPVDDPVAAAHRLYFRLIRPRSPASAYCRTYFRRRSRTVAIEYERITVVLKIGRSAVRPRPWPLYLTCPSDNFLDLFVRDSSQFSHRNIHCCTCRAWAAVEILAAINGLAMVS